MPHRFHLIDLLCLRAPLPSWSSFSWWFSCSWSSWSSFSWWPLLCGWRVGCESRCLLGVGRLEGLNVARSPAGTGPHRFIYLVVKRHGSPSGTVLADQRDPTSWALPVCRPCTYRGAGAPRYSVYGIRRSSFSPDPDALKDLGPGSRTTVHGMRWTELTWPHHT